MLTVDVCADDSDSDGDDQEGLSLAHRQALLIDFWSVRSVSDETGATDRATLEELERQVTDALCGPMPDIDLAESLTCEAFYRIAGNIL
jgi:hypothetical protein